MSPPTKAADILLEIVRTMEALRDEVLRAGDAASPRERLEADLDVLRARLELARELERNRP